MTIETANRENGLLADEAERRSQVVSNLLSVSTHLVSVLDPVELLPGLAARAVGAVPSLQAGLVWLYERTPATLRVVSTHGLSADVNTQAVSIRLRLGEGLAGAVLQHGEPLLVESRQSYRELATEVSPRNTAAIRALVEYLPTGTRAVLLPLRIGTETIGVLELLNLGQVPALRRPDLQTLQTFANLAAAAIKNAQLHAQMHAHQRRLEALDAVNTAVSAAGDLAELERDVLDVLLGVVNAPCGALLLLDRRRMVLELVAQQHLPPDCVPADGMPVTGSPCEEAVRYGQPIRRPLVVGGSEQPLLDAGHGSIVYLPLLAGGTVVGVACLVGDATLSERVDVPTLMTISNQIGFAIANVLLYQESQSERLRLSAVVGSLAEGVALCDAEGRLALVNAAAREILALDDVPYQQPIAEMPEFYAMRGLDGVLLTAEAVPFARALGGEVFHDYRLVLRGASGNETVISTSGAPVAGNDGAPVGAVVVFRDVTAQQKLERAKDDFLAVAAHELRSPLAAVRSYTDLLVRREQQRVEASGDMRGLTLLAQQVAHMLRMVDNLLDVSRIDADQFHLQLGTINLVALAEQVIEQQRPAAGDRQLALESRRRELYVVCDQLRLRQVLTNLVGNAIRYSAPATKIDVCVDLRSAAELAARHPEFAAQRSHSAWLAGEAQLALVTVTDQGRGIAEDQALRLFRRYERGSERRGEGLGLGLYLSRAFVERHHGAIWVESELGQGSAFYVAVPLETDEALTS